MIGVNLCPGEEYSASPQPGGLTSRPTPHLIFLAPLTSPQLSLVNAAACLYDVFLFREFSKSNLFICRWRANIIFKHKLYNCHTMGHFTTLIKYRKIQNLFSGQQIPQTVSASWCFKQHCESYCSIRQINNQDHTVQITKAKKKNKKTLLSRTVFFQTGENRCTRI